MSVRIGCQDAIRRLWQYLDDELENVDQQAVEEHLAFCRRCCGELAFAKELRRTLTRSEVDLPVDVQERLDDFIDDLDSSTGTGATT